MYALIVTLAVLPAILISWYIIRQDKYEPEPRLHLALSFVAGMLLSLPALWAEKQFVALGWDDPTSIWRTFCLAFIGVALVEEGFKALGLYLYPYSQPFFNEPMDGIVYSVMISMGFATLENVLYADRFGLETVLVRAFTAVPAHAAFGVFLGYFAGKAKFSHRPGYWWRRGLLLTVLLHGAYDLFIIQEWFSWLILLALVVLAVGIYMAREMIDEQQENSPFKP